MSIAAYDRHAVTESVVLPPFTAGGHHASILAVSPVDPATIASAVDGLPDRSIRGMVGAGLVYLAGLRWPLILGGKQAKPTAAGRTPRNVTA